jgi:hemerythrin
MKLQFTPDLSTTVKEIDDQHKELFKRVDSLNASLAQGSARAELVRTVEYLTEYVVFHFGVEEKYMTRYGYLNAVQHTAQHDQFVKTFMRLRDRLFLEGITPRITEDTQQLVVDWLINHIKYSDKALGLFLKRRLPA